MDSKLSKSPRKRLATLDIARMVCIILVVIGHYDPSNAPVQYNNLLKVIYTFHMPVFLFISGYLYIVTRREEETFAAFIIKKIKRLAIPYLATSIIIITIKLLTQGSARVDHPVTTLSYLRMFYLPEAGYFLWFIIALMMMFMIVFHFKSRTSRLVLLVVSFAISLLPSCDIDILCLRQCQAMMVYFMTGVVIADYAPNIFKLNTGPTLIILLLLAVGEAYYVQHQDSMLMYRSLAFLGIAAVMPLCHNCERHVPVLARSCVLLAPSVYIIYLFHTTIEGFGKAFLEKFPILDTFSLQAIIIIALAFIIPILLHHLILKRFATTRFLFGL